MGSVACFDVWTACNVSSVGAPGLTVPRSACASRSDCAAVIAALNHKPPFNWTVRLNEPLESREHRRLTREGRADEVSPQRDDPHETRRRVTRGNFTGANRGVER